MVRRPGPPRGIVGQHALEDVHARPIGGEPQPVGAARRQLPRTQVEIGNRELVGELVRVSPCRPTSMVGYQRCAATPCPLKVATTIESFIVAGIRGTEVTADRARPV